MLITWLACGCASVYEIEVASPEPGPQSSAIHAQIVDCCATNELRVTSELPDSQHKTWWLESVAEDDTLLEICHGQNCRVWVYAEKTHVVASVQPNPGLARPSDVAEALRQCIAEARPGWIVETKWRVAPDLR